MKFVMLTVYMSGADDCEAPMWVRADRIVSLCDSIVGPGALVRIDGGKDVKVHESVEQVRQMLCDCGALFYGPSAVEA